MDKSEYLQNKSFKHKALAVAAMTAISCGLLVGCGNQEISQINDTEAIQQQNDNTPIVLKFNDNYYAFNMINMSKGYNNGTSYCISTEEGYTIHIKQSGLFVLTDPDGEDIGMDTNGAIIMHDTSELEKFKIDENQKTNISFDYDMEQDQNSIDNNLEK